MALALAWANSFPLSLSLYVVPAFAFLLSTIVLAGFEWIPDRLYPRLAVVASLCAAAMYVGASNDLVSIIGDNTVYIRDAMHLANGEPMVDTGYGVGVKLMITPAVMAFGLSVFAMKLVIALSASTLPVLVFLVLRESSLSSRAYTVGVLTCTVWFVLHMARTVTADVPYTVFSMLALYLCAEYGRRPPDTWKWLALAAGAVGWAYLVKSPAMFVALAFCIHCILRGRWRHGLLLLAGAATVIVPNMVYLMVEHPGRVGYFSSITDQIRNGQYIPQDLIGTFWDNLAYLLIHKNPVDFLSNMSNLPYQFGWQDTTHILWVPIQAIGAVLIALWLISFILSRLPSIRSPMALLQSLEIWDWYTLAYLATLFVLPGAPIRYLIPIVPFLLYHILRGLDLALLVTRRPLIAQVGVVAMSATLWTSSAHGSSNLISYFQRNIYPAYWAQYHEAAQWVRANVDPESRIATRKPGLVWFWTGGMDCEIYPFVDDTEDAFSQLQAFDHVIMGSGPFFGSYRRRYLTPVIKAHPESFTVIHSTGAPSFHVLEVDPGTQIGNADSMLAVAVDHIGHHRYDEAKALLEPLRASIPSSRDVALCLGLVHLRLGNTALAIVECQRAIELDPQEAKAYLLLGQIELKRGLVGPAIEAFSEAVRLSPENEAIRKILDNIMAANAVQP